MRDFHDLIRTHPAVARLSRRRDGVIIAVAMAVIGWLAGAAWVLPIAGVGAVVAWCAFASLSPRVEGARALSTRAVGSAGHSDSSTLVSNIIGAFNDPILLIDRRGSVVAANAAAQALFPVSLGHMATQIIRSTEFAAAIASATAANRATKVDLHLGGPIEQHLSGNVQPLRLTQGATPSHLLIALRDTGEEQRLAEMRAAFVANASHELRTPLASLRGFVETLQGSAKDDPAAREKFLAIMQDQAERMTRLIENLLSLSRIEMRVHLPPSEAIDLAVLMADIDRMMQPLAKTAEQNLALMIKDAPAFVAGDRDELIEAIQNLIQNAFKYGTRGGHVIVSLKREGNNIIVAVDDDGIGIAPEHLPRLTERFYRVNTKESRERGGTGLGLAIVKHVVNRHGGDLKIESRLGRGSTFSLRLPARGAIEATG